ncbi:MAG: ABC transporter ATP-binding protein [Candidatus Fermentibacteraceae bacterium]|nr:ABC transporter ATP-binding protein [Candidatus Fermentibacteraceae bacterium]MBN2609346.1 ABC transporter ATP-binding protein [Candidatus Fermentibacteraceae bacterium]
MRNNSFAEDEVGGKLYDRTLVRRLLRYVKPHRKLIFLAMFFMIITACVELLIPYLTKQGIDNYLAKLYQIYTAPADVCYELVAASPDSLDFMPLAVDTTILVRKAALDRMDPAGRVQMERDGELSRETYYLFPGDRFNGETGSIMNGHWLVPERELSKVPLSVIMDVRGGDIAGISRLAFILGALIILSLAAGYGHVMTLVVAGQRSMYDVRTELFRHIQDLSLKFYSQNPIGRLVTRVTNDIEALNEMFTAVLVDLIKDVLLIIGTAIILFILNVKLALISLAVTPIFILVTVIFRVKARGAYREVRKFLAKLNSRLSEDLSGIKIVQVFRQERRRREEYRETNVSYFSANMKQLIIFGIFRPLIEVTASIGVALVLIYGGGSVLSGALTIGALVAFISYVRQMFQPLSDISQKYNIMQSAMAAAERIFTILDTKPDITDSPTTDGIDLTGGIEFEDVDFSYDKDNKVLCNVSFAVEPGRSVALVGPTGAGKTSIISLLCRFYDVDSGRILLDGRDIRELPVRNLRDSISIVLQDAFIFSRTIEDNIRLGLDLTREQVRLAADMVQATPFIEKLPQGFDTVMAERGATLSTGQKQLICFARALAHDPRILVLDEATSNVDPATEMLIQNAIGVLMQNRTSIVVAHRLSTIQKADQILVIDGGRILERGNHQELLARRGIYYNLYLLQYSQSNDA